MNIISTLIKLIKFVRIISDITLSYFISIKNIFYARDGDRTHAHIRELDLKSNALTTRPPGLVFKYQINLRRKSLQAKICFNL